MDFLPSMLFTATRRVSAVSHQIIPRILSMPLLSMSLNYHGGPSWKCGLMCGCTYIWFWCLQSRTSLATIVELPGSIVPWLPEHLTRSSPAHSEYVFMYVAVREAELSGNAAVVTIGVEPATPMSMVMLSSNEAKRLLQQQRSSDLFVPSGRLIITACFHSQVDTRSSVTRKGTRQPCARHHHRHRLKSVRIVQLNDAVK
jgi:hypothetical protein